MRRQPESREKPLYWVGASKPDLLAMPEPVIRHIGFALGVAQYGGKQPDTKPWKGQGAGIFEIVSDFDTNTFRAAYVVRFEQAVYVLHCFQKKSPSGARTAKTDVNLIDRRLKAARADYEVRYGKANQER
jgi:phage-related protein